MFFSELALMRAFGGDYGETIMPKYELMYIIGSNTADDIIPKVTAEIRGFIESQGGVVEKHEDLGKKKLTYEIKSSKTGHYILVNFSAEPNKLQAIEHKILTNQAIIRHLIINMDEALVRMARDQKNQAKMRAARPKEFLEAEASPEKKPAKPTKKVEIDLDAEIEKALETEDLK